jgi:hypothetical protein
MSEPDPVKLNNEKTCDGDRCIPENFTVYDKILIQ